MHTNNPYPIIIQYKLFFTKMSSGFYFVSSICYLNMSSEIMFVLQNRMKAQKIDMNTVGSKIMCDITLLLFRPSFIDFIIKPQNPISISALYELFNKMVNSSYMKLDKASMQKLFLLILMTFKKQIFMLSSPLQLYTLTLTHLRDVCNIQKNKTESLQCIQSVIEKFKVLAEQWTYLQYFEIKQEILSTLESYKSKVVLFCETGTQDKQGYFIFVPRNTHNRQQLNLSTNQSNSQKQRQIALQWKDTENLPYSDYQHWQTKLCKNDYDSARNLSKSTQQKAQEQIQFTGKQLSQILGIKNQNLDNFQLDLDLFHTNSPQKHPKTKNPSSTIKKNIHHKSIQHKQTKCINDIKSKIDRQFDDLL